MKTTKNNQTLNRAFCALALSALLFDVTVRPVSAAESVHPPTEAVPMITVPLFSDRAVGTDEALPPRAFNAEEINKEIYGMNYDPNVILVRTGEPLQSFVPKEGSFKGDKYIVVEKKKQTIDSKPFDISVVQSIANRTYPGAIQLANKNLVENRPQLVPTDRKPIDITIDLPGLENENTIQVKNPSYSTVNAARDSLIEKWAKEKSETHTLPAKIQYTESKVYSKSQIAAKLNINAELIDKSLGIDFNAVASGEKTVLVAAYKQIFYNVSAKLPAKPADLFADDVTVNDLKNYGMNENNPPVLVTDVSYGRTFYVKMETTSKSTEVEAAFKALLKDKAKIEANSKFEEILKNSSFTVVVLGGDAESHNEIVTAKDFEEIHKIIKRNAKFGLKNPGFPISYSASFIKDNQIAVINNHTEYIETTATEYTGGKVNLYHRGGYVAQFVVEWDEFTYDKDGNEKLTHNTWDKSWHSTTSGFNTVIPLPANAKNIRIYARECTGLAWEWWRVIMDERNVALSPNINVNIWGTTLYPRTSLKH